MLKLFFTSLSMSGWIILLKIERVYGFVLAKMIKLSDKQFKMCIDTEIHRRKKNRCDISVT